MTAEVSGLRRRMYEDVDYIYIYVEDGPLKGKAKKNIKGQSCNTAIRKRLTNKGYSYNH